MTTSTRLFKWFDNLTMTTKLKEFYYSQGKNTRCGSAAFSLKTTHQTDYLSCAQDSQQAKRPKIFPRPLHGLSIRKNLIKNRNTFISGQFINLDQI